MIKFPKDIINSLRGEIKKKNYKFREVASKSFEKVKKKVKSNKKIVEIYNSSSRWILFEALPSLQKKTDLIIERLVKEEGSDYWSALNPTQKWSSRIVWTLVGVSTFGIVWSSSAKIDETVQAQGRLEPKGTTIDVKVPLGGVIENILVKEGQLVSEDELLLRLDTTAVEAKLKALKRVRAQVAADILLSRNQLGEDIKIDGLNDNQKLKMDSLIKEYDSRINASLNAVKQSELQVESMLAKINSLKDVLIIRSEILRNLNPLVKEGAISKIQYLKEEQEVIQLKGQISSFEADLERFESVLDENQNRLNNTIAASEIDFTTKIEESSKQIAQLDNQISEAEVTLSYQEITSPLDGIVFDLQAAAPGYVVNSSLPILKIVPTDDLVARIFVSNADIAFLKVGQAVNIRVDAYPYNEFGEIKGLIKSIGSDVLEPDDKYQFFRFPITVELEEPFLVHKETKLPLVTGMSLSVNVVLRQRPVISLFTEKVLPFWDGLEQM